MPISSLGMVLTSPYTISSIIITKVVGCESITIDYNWSDLTPTNTDNKASRKIPPHLARNFKGVPKVGKA